jgi:archaemetzincin
MRVHGHGDRFFWLVILSVGLVTGVAVYLCSAMASPDPPPAAKNNPKKTKNYNKKRKGKRAPARAGGRSWRWEQLGKKSKKRASSFSRSAQLRRKLIFAQVQGDEAFTRLGEPEPGDWLWSFKEPGQTLNDYARTVQNRKLPGRQTLHLQPFSDLKPVHRRVLAQVQEHTALYFDTEVKVLPTIKVKSKWYNRRREQYHAGLIVRHLARRTPADSLGLFGLMGSDLYGLRLNFVFGMALLHQRAGLFSLRRYGTSRPELLRRALKLSSHELGHIFGLKHCVFYECGMNGTNSLHEMDRQPMHLCPVCLAKLKWNLGIDPVKRYRKLSAFYRRVGLKAEADFARDRAKELSR